MKPFKRAVAAAATLAVGIVGAAYYFASIGNDNSAKLTPVQGGAPAQGAAPVQSSTSAKGDHDDAIAHYTEAIQLDPKNSVAYNNRGLANNAEGEYDRAIADFSEAIRLNPEYALAYNNRCLAHNNKGESDFALADCNEAIRLAPKYTRAYINRGIASLYAGSLPKALADLNQWSELDPTNAYAALWLDIIDKRSNLASRLPDATKQIDMTKWPAPIMRLFLGQVTEEALLIAADHPDANIKRGQVCEANFFTGELMLQRGKKDEAARLFRLAAADCPKDFVQSAAANAELKVLGRKPAEQKTAELTYPEQKAPQPKSIEPAPAGPQTIAVKLPEPEVKPTQQAILETGYDQLKGLGREAAGYGLYSYGLLTTPSPRSAAFLDEIFKSNTAAARTQLNNFYIPTKKDKVVNLAVLVAASRNDQSKLSGRYSEAMYDYKMARAILSHLCNPPPKPMKDLCKGPMSGGPYILTGARPASSLEPVPPPFLFVDLSDINPHAYPEFISAFRAVVKQEDVTDDGKLHSQRLKVLNLALTAADWIPKTKKSVVDIAHAFDTSSDGQASR